MDSLALSRNGCRLKPVRSDADWTAYDGIRRTVLFEDLMDRAGYIARHEDEFADGNHPFLLIGEGIPVGTVRIDIRSPDLAILRLIAIRRGDKGRGYGRTLMALAERFAGGQGATRIALNADPSAASFYAALGYTADVWCQAETAADIVQMTKSLAA